jgi:hypothetical protein
MSVLIVERIVDRIAIVSSLRGITLMISMVLISAQLLAQPRRKEHGVEHPTFYRTVQVDGVMSETIRTSNNMTRISGQMNLPF